MSEPIYLTEDIRRIEAAAKDAPLMELAGTAAAALAARICAEDAKDVLVLTGPGNNGGDARIVAERLKQQFFRVTLATVADVAALPVDRRWGLVVDGLFGIGLARDIEGEFARLVDYANAQDCPRLALDIPSGIHADTGRVLGRAMRATHTITFIALKPGLLTLDGPDHCGEISVADLDLDVKKLARPGAWVASPALFAEALNPRPRNFHKGSAGSLAVLGGAAGMTGAALLAGRAALRLGAGRVYVGTLEDMSLDPGAPELMLRHPDDALGQDLDAVVVGPGLGGSERAEAIVGAVLASDMPCVLDADALNLIADNKDLRTACARRKAETLLTPHPGEAGRLLAQPVAEVQRDRVAAARRIAENLNAHVVLKGNGSVLVARDGHWFINTSGNPGMASAGMGDVLSGFLGALLAQKLSGEAALVLGVHLHGCAADAAGIGVGLTASELIDPARRIWNGWLNGDRPHLVALVERLALLEADGLEVLGVARAAVAIEHARLEHGEALLQPRGLRVGAELGEARAQLLLVGRAAFNLREHDRAAQLALLALHRLELRGDGDEFLRLRRERERRWRGAREQQERPAPHAARIRARGSG